MNDEGVECMNYPKYGTKIINVPGAKQRKYGNTKTVIDGITFDSQKEADRYAELKLLERAGQIENLILQKEFELIPTQYENINGKNAKCLERGVKYKADFFYIENGQPVVEDVKGVKTEVYKIKKKLMLYKYGIRIREV